MNSKYYILSFLFFWTTLLFAQEGKFTASVSKTQVATGEVLEVTFSINGNADRFSPPNFNGFQVVSGPNVSTSMTSFNGNTTTSSSYSYEMVAVKEGTFTIAPASVVSGGRTLITQPIKITVIKGKPVPQSSRGNGGGAGMDEASASDVSRLIFMRAIVDKTNVYQGEQITVSYRLYSRIDILESQATKLPELNGFWSQDEVPPKGNVQWRTEVYNGQRYNVADLKKTVLFPEHSGNLTVDGLGETFAARVPSATHDIMDQFFGGGYRDQKVKLISPPVTVHVKPLPETGKPDGYAGAVGNFSITSSVDKTSLKANEAITYNVKITGAGNIKLFKPLTTNFPADFDKYDPKVTDTITNGPKGISGSRIYDYLLIPRHGGKYTIDPVKFSYFNPATGKYVNLDTKSYQVEVAKGAHESNVTAFSSADKQDIKLLDKDIRYIKSDAAGLSKEAGDFFGSVLFYLLLLLGPVLVIAGAVYRSWYEKANSDIVKVKSRKASKLAAKHLANAQKQLQAKNSKAFYEDLFKGIYGYLSFKLNIPYANLDKENIAAALKAKSVSERLITQLEDTLDLCDMARFSPVTGISEQDVFEKAKTMINDIEDEL